MTDHPTSSKNATSGRGVSGQRGVSRRALLAGAGTAAAGVAGLAWYGGSEGGWRAETAILRAPRYDASLPRRLREGLKSLGIDRQAVHRKRILLKPNLVEPSREAPHINTHPLFVRSVAEVFLQLDAAEVIVGEGQGHIRDSWYVLEQSGLQSQLDDTKLSFIDLNVDRVFTAKNAGGRMKERKLYLPQTLRRVDWIVSLPKMKTHHWAGATLAMKNLFGVMPGICYGWPKNVLHFNGIPQSIYDINATVRPHLAIVDGIVGMEGDGPIMGTPKAAGVIVMGRNFPAVDATCCRLMQIDPRRVPYLRLSSGRLGPILERHIEQRGESIAACAKPFATLPDSGLLPETSPI